MLNLIIIFFRSKYFYVNLIIITLVTLAYSLYVYEMNNISNFLDIVMISLSWLFLSLLVLSDIFNNKIYLIPIINILLFIYIHYFLYSNKKIMLWYIYTFIYILLNILVSSLFLHIASQ